jgi:hypothetical protein
MTSRDSLDFSWEAVAGADHYKVSIAAVKGGKTIAHEDWLRSVNWRFSNLALLDVGDFIFKVTACRDAPDGSTQESAVTSVRFTLSLKDSLKAPQILSPDTFYLRNE